MGRTNWRDALFKGFLYDTCKQLKKIAPRLYEGVYVSLESLKIPLMVAWNYSQSTAYCQDTT